MRDTILEGQLHINIEWGIIDNLDSSPFSDFAVYLLNVVGFSDVYAVSPQRAQIEETHNRIMERTGWVLD